MAFGLGLQQGSPHPTHDASQPEWECSSDSIIRSTPDTAVTSDKLARLVLLLCGQQVSAAVGNIKPVAMIEVKAKTRNIHFVPMLELLPEDITSLPIDSVKTAPLPGREGWVCWQASFEL